MLDTPGFHFAISEVLIVAVALWAAIRLSKVNLRFAAAGVLIFGIAAAIGTCRFGLGEIDGLATIHGRFSQIGGAVAMSLVAAEIILLSQKARFVRYAVWATIAISAGFALITPHSSVPLFVTWLIFSIIGAALLPSESAMTRISRACVTALFLLNLLAVRQSTALGVGLSWHVFHILVAVWIIGVAHILLSAEHKTAAPIRG